MKTLITRCAFLACAFLGGVHSDLDAKLDEATRELRSAIIRLRDIRTTSCNDLRQSQDCDLAALSNAELLLLDIESKYARAARSSASSKDREEFERITNAADEAK
jgi:hypothetical protein